MFFTILHFFGHVFEQKFAKNKIVKEGTKRQRHRGTKRFINYFVPPFDRAQGMLCAYVPILKNKANFASLSPFSVF
ncbi:MAG: hypothetical protein A2Z25_04435 [Planctomycetes bacterium RBG_16_55_9]|nr:MAG: hypothetical protein A2Z25_04435 [Planctomycetes bacterium RBG_16_55_9]